MSVMAEPHMVTQRSPLEDRIETLRGRYAYSEAVPWHELEALRQMAIEREEHYRALREALDEHVSGCSAPGPDLTKYRSDVIQRRFERNRIVHADRRSGKTTALFNAAQEYWRDTSAQITLIAPKKEMLIAEASRRRLNGEKSDTFRGMVLIGEQEIESRLHGTQGMEVMVDEWFSLKEQSRLFLARNARVRAATGTIAHGEVLPPLFNFI